MAKRRNSVIDREAERQQAYLRLQAIAARDGLELDRRPDAVTRYCETWALWRECLELLKLEGLRIGGEAGVGNPRLSDFLALSRLHAAQASELGLLPTKVKPEAERKRDHCEDRKSRRAVVYQFGK